LSISQKKTTGLLAVEVILKRDIDGAEHTELGHLAPFGIRAIKKDYSTLLFNGHPIVENNPFSNKSTKYIQYSVTIRYSLP